jgi:hypothetical protein
MNLTSEEKLQLAEFIHIMRKVSAKKIVAAPLRNGVEITDKEFEVFDSLISKLEDAAWE